MAKQMKFGDEARGALKVGIDSVAKAVAATMGPKGRNVAYQKSYGGPVISNDGVSVAKEVSLSDPFAQMGVEVIKEVAEKMNKAAGDGTTTATVLAHAMITEGMKFINRQVEVTSIKKGIDDAVEAVVSALKDQSSPISTLEEIQQVATVSVENAELGRVIAETIQKVGSNGVVTVEESRGSEIESEIVEGMSFDKGYASPYMVTDQERLEAVLERSSVLVTDQKIDNVKEILPLLEKMLSSGQKDLIVIADDFSNEITATLVVNKMRGIFNVLAIKAPGFGDRKKEMLEDIAVMVGATVVSSAIGMKLDTVSDDVLGKADKVIASKDKTIIIGGAGTKGAVESRVTALKGAREKMTSSYDIEKVDERIAKLSGGVAIIRVGAATETEMKYLKDKIEDAVNATKAALEEGIVAGGGSALVVAAKKVEKKLEGKDIRTDYWEGYRIVIEACKSPLRQIAINAGFGDGSMVVAKVMEMGDKAGFNASSNTYSEDLVKDGIIDPVKVTRNAVLNAASAAGTFLTTEVAIAEIPEKKSATGGHSHDDEY